MYISHKSTRTLTHALHQPHTVLISFGYKIKLANNNIYIAHVINLKLSDKLYYLSSFAVGSI